MAAAPLLRPGALPAVIVPPSRKAGRSFDRISNVVSGLRRLVDRERLGALPALDLDRDDLRRELACLLGRAEERCCERAAKRSCASRESCARVDEILGVPARMLAREGIVEAIAKHAVVDLRWPHAVAPAAAVHQIGRAVHVLHAAGNCRLDLARGDLLRGRDDGLRAGAADAVHRHRRHRDRNAAADRCLSRRVHLVAGLDRRCPARRCRPRLGRAWRVSASPARRWPRDRLPARSLREPLIGPDRGADRAGKDDLLRAHEWLLTHRWI